MTASRLGPNTILQLPTPTWIGCGLHDRDDAVDVVARLLSLPKGFVRIRYYGFLANCRRREPLALARELLAEPVAEPASETATADSTPQPHCCPLCRQGRMLLVETFEPLPPATVIVFDSS